MAKRNASYVIPFRELDLSRISDVGGKNASLGELIQHLDPLGVRVPDGFALTGGAFQLHLREAGIEEEIYAALDDLDVRDLGALARAGRFARERVRSARLPAAVVSEVESAYARLSGESGEEATDVAVRSSATAEDLPTASFAGQQETFLNVHGLANLLHAILGCMASLFTDRAIVYRTEHGFPHRDVLLSVGVQKMVRSDQASAGVIFTLDTETGFRDVVLVTGAWGLGETVVQGTVNPDEFWVHKPTLRTGHRPIVRRELGEKAIKLVYGDRSDTRSVKTLAVPEHERRRAVLTDDEVLELSRWAIAIEDHYSKVARAPDPDGHRVGQGRAHRSAVRRAGATGDRPLAARAAQDRDLQAARQGRGARARQERRRQGRRRSRAGARPPRGSLDVSRGGDPRGRRDRTGLGAGAATRRRGGDRQGRPHLSRGDRVARAGPAVRGRHPGRDASARDGQRGHGFVRRGRRGTRLRGSDRLRSSGDRSGARFRGLACR